MAWYEMQGGGIPASLKNEMDSVLNKKWGTSTTYPADTWPDTVNLMGPLPEKTVSGSVVAFSDGADTVPLKKCEITLPASLDGYSYVDVIHAGKNLFNVADYSQIYTDRDGVDSYNYRYMIIHLKPNTTYTVSQNSGEAKSTPIVLINSVLPVGGSNYLDLRTASGSKTYTTGDDGYLYIGSVNSYDDVVYARLQECNIQIEAGSTATTYEPYTAPTTHTADLGRTIHGGKPDVVAGQGNGEWAIIKLKDLTWYYSTSYGGFFHSPSIQSVVSDETYICVSSEYMNVRLNSYQLQNTDDAIGINADNGSAVTGGAPLKSIVVKDTDYTTVADLIAHFTANDSTLCYKLATPETFTFDPISIDSKLGNNTIWSEQGSIEVTYRADINLALGQ